MRAVWELLARRFEAFELRPYLEPDQSQAKRVLELAGPGDLVLRDLGYFSTEALGLIGEAGARYLSRLHSCPKIRSLAGGEIDLLELLGERGRLDEQLLVGPSRLRCRVLALRLDPALAAERRRRLRRRQPRASPRRLALERWTILVTNASPQELSAEQAAELYRQRWSVEIAFKSWKSGLGLDRLPPRCGGSLAVCLVLANLIRSTLGQSLLAPLLERRCGSVPSPVKLATLLALPRVGRRQDPQSLLDHLAWHSRYERRRRPSLHEQLEALRRALG